MGRCEAYGAEHNLSLVDTENKDVFEHICFQLDFNCPHKWFLAQELRRTWLHTERQTFTDTQKGEYIPFGAIIMAEGGWSGPAGEANVVASICYVRRFLGHVSCSSVCVSRNMQVSCLPVSSFQLDRDGYKYRCLQLDRDGYKYRMCRFSEFTQRAEFLCPFQTTP